MTTEFEATTRIDAPQEAVWEILADIGNIDQWAALISKSTVKGSPGLNAVRNCTLVDGASVEETFVGWNEGSSIQYNLTGDLPVSHMTSTWSLKAEGDQTHATYHGTFEPLDAAMADPLQEKLTGFATFLLAALKTRVETGTVLALPA